jgi:hypothetical protein
MQGAVEDQPAIFDVFCLPLCELDIAGRSDEECPELKIIVSSVKWWRNIT